MNLKYRKSMSTNYPELIDSTSSKFVVYIRRNITETLVDDTTFYEYEEAKITKEEYKQYLEELNASSVFEDIETLKAENEELKAYGEELGIQNEELSVTLDMILTEILPTLME